MDFPSQDLGFHGGYVSNAPIKTLPFQHTEFYLGYVEPAAMLGGVMYFKPRGQTLRFLRLTPW